MKSCIVSDFDGTIFQNKSLLLPKELLLEKKICFNTLRSPAGLLGKIGVDRLSFPSIHFGGSLIYDTFNSKTVFHYPIDKNVYDLFEKECDSKKIDHRIIYVKDNAISSVNVTYENEKTKTKEDIVLECIQSIDKNDINDSDIIAIYTSEYINANGLRFYTDKNSNYLYITDKTDKGISLMKLKSIYNIETIYSFGDGEDDFPMLDISNYAYYVGSGSKYNNINENEIINIIKEIDVE